jgi:hypothetical protein
MNVCEQPWSLDVSLTLMRALEAKKYAHDENFTNNLRPRRHLRATAWRDRGFMYFSAFSTLLKVKDDFQFRWVTGVSGLRGGLGINMMSALPAAWFSLEMPRCFQDRRRTMGCRAS